MAESIYSNSTKGKSYSGTANAYTFYLEVLLNSQDEDQKTSNVTIRHYAHGNIGFNYAQFSSPRSYIDLYNSVDDTTTRVAETKVAAIPLNTKTLIGSWTGDIAHAPDGTLQIKATASYKPNTTSYTYVPANHSLASTVLELPSLHTAPTIESVVVTEENSIVKSTGVSGDVFVPYVSNKTVTINAISADNTALVEYQITDGVNIFSSPVEDVPMNLSKGLNYGTSVTVLNMTVIDAVGSITTHTESYSVIPYTLPSLSNANSNVKRNGQTTGKAVLNLKGTFYNKTVGNLANSVSLKFTYWEVGTEENTTYYTIPASAYTVSGNEVTLTNWPVAINGTEITDLDKNNSYIFKVILTDSFEKESVITLSGIGGAYVMAKFKDRVDFKKVTQENKAIWEIIYPIGAVYTSVNDVDPSIIFEGTTWERIKDTFLLASGDTYANGSTGGEPEHTLTVDELPAHGHSIASSGAHKHLFEGYVQTSISNSTSYLSISRKRISGDPEDVPPSMVNNSGDHTHTASDTGGNAAHNNMPPYLAVYMWKRIA